MDNKVIPLFPTSWSSSRWLKSKIHPDMEPHYKEIVISILETGLLFKEDALKLEDALQVDDIYYNGDRNFIDFRFTSGERILSAVAIGVLIAAMPMKLSIGYKANFGRALCWAGAGISIPILHRLMVPNTLPALLKSLSDYTILVRKCMSCVKEQSLNPRSPRSMSVNAMNSVLIEQHRDICQMIERANAVLRPLFPWLVMSPLFGISNDYISTYNDSLIKLHHLYLILQSYFLRTVAAGHLRKHKRSASLNRNEKIHWLHNTIFPIITESINYHLSSLNNAYRIFKDINLSKDLVMKTMPKIVREPWQYSEVHANIVLCSSEIRSALIRSNEMDTFLEACWNAKSKFSPAILEADLVKLKEDVMKCFSTIDNIAIQLKKIHTAEMKLLEQAVQKLHLPAVEEEEVDVTSANIRTVSENTVMDVKDEVYYFEKTDDFNPSVSAQDYLTGPGANEIKTTKIVLDELKIKLIKREDDMRHREAIALENTMPEYKGNLPEFPRQINCDDEVEECPKCILKSKLYKPADNHILQRKVINNDNTNADITNGENEQPFDNNNSCILKIDDASPVNGNVDNHSKMRYDIAYIEADSSADEVLSGSEDESDTDPYDLDDLEGVLEMRRKKKLEKHRYPPTYDASCVDGPSSDVEKNNNDGSEPVKYTFGTGMAMASLLHSAKPNPEAYSYNNYEETFAGSGEVSEDSGNET